jgi:hypothetical protein
VGVNNLDLNNIQVDKASTRFTQGQSIARAEGLNDFTVSALNTWTYVTGLALDLLPVSDREVEVLLNLTASTTISNQVEVRLVDETGAVYPNTYGGWALMSGFTYDTRQFRFVLLPSVNSRILKLNVRIQAGALTVKGGLDTTLNQFIPCVLEAKAL